MTESGPSQESTPSLPPIEQHELKGEFWRLSLAQAARERSEGTRPTEDIVHVNPDLSLFTLCDGIGGNADGREAATVVSEAIDEHFKTVDMNLDDHEATAVLPSEMVNAIRHAQLRLLEARDRKPEMPEQDEGKMDTTVTALMLRKLSNGRVVAIIGQVGNSRAYLVPKNREVDQLTVDQDIMFTRDGAALILGKESQDEATLDATRKRVRDEMASATDVKSLSEEARMLYNYRNITMSVGSKGMRAVVDVYPVPEGGRIALVSDGVFENLGKHRTERALSMVHIKPAGELAPDIVREAQQNGHDRPKNVITSHPDDTTAMFIECP